MAQPKIVASATPAGHSHIVCIYEYPVMYTDHTEYSVNEYAFGAGFGQGFGNGFYTYDRDQAMSEFMRRIDYRYELNVKPEIPEHPADCLFCQAGEPMVHNYEPPSD